MWQNGKILSDFEKTVISNPDFFFFWFRINENNYYPSDNNIRVVSDVFSAFFLYVEKYE